MELWTTLIAPGILLILGICCPQVWPCLTEKASHMWEVKENLVELRIDWVVLMGIKNNVLSRVDAGEKRGEQQLPIVSKWLLEVKTIETIINRLLPDDASDRDTAYQGAYSNDAAPVHQKLPTCGCCYKFSSCCLGEEVFKTLDKVRRLYPMGETFEVVTEAPPLVVEIIEEKYTDSFMIGARKIEITHAEKPENWTWSSVQEASNQAATEIATMKEVYWMDIRGSYSTRKLVLETKYKVVFVVKLEDIAIGWDEPVNLSLKISMRDQNEIVQEQTSNMEDYIGTNEWVDIEVGDFVAPPKDAPTKIITFAMYQHDSSFRKTGLVARGVAIRPMD